MGQCIQYNMKFILVPNKIEMVRNVLPLKYIFYCINVDETGATLWQQIHIKWCLYPIPKTLG